MLWIHLYQHHMLCWKRLVRRGQRAGSRSLIFIPVTLTAKYEYIYTYMFITHVYLFIFTFTFIFYFISLCRCVCPHTCVPWHLCRSQKMWCLGARPQSSTQVLGGLDHNGQVYFLIKEEIFNHFWLCTAHITNFCHLHFQPSIGSGCVQLFWGSLPNRQSTASNH